MARYLVLASLIACSNGPSEGMTPDGSIQTSQLDPASCTAFAQSFASAAQTCGSPLPAGAQASFEGWCKKGIASASMCGGNPRGGLDCFKSADPNDWVCSLGQPYPACNGDLSSALGALCVVALGNPSCATGVKCEYDADCSNGFQCNSMTHQCMSKTAYCIGLPCGYDVDCSANEKCDSAEHACIGK